MITDPQVWLSGGEPRSGVLELTIREGCSHSHANGIMGSGPTLSLFMAPRPG